MRTHYTNWLADWQCLPKRGDRKMILVRRIWFSLGVFLLISMSTTALGQGDTLPKRNTFTFPTQIEPLARGLEEAGFNIVYGPNSVPAPQRISEEAKQVWASLPQIPFGLPDLEKRWLHGHRPPSGRGLAERRIRH